MENSQNCLACFTLPIMRSVLNSWQQCTFYLDLLHLMSSMAAFARAQCCI